MSKNKIGGLLAAGALVAALISPWMKQVSAATAALTLTVSGTIAPSPAWQNSAGVEISMLSFNFSGLVAADPSKDVDSSVALVKLVNASTYPATVSLMKPIGCAIGATAVTDRNVHFLNNGMAVTTNSNISIPNNTSRRFQLRFAAAGKYGSASGAVVCSKVGSLTYTY